MFSGVVVDRGDLERVGAYRTQLIGSEDWDLWIRLLRSGVHVVRPDRPTVLYRRNGTGLTETGRGLAGAATVARLAASEMVGDIDQPVAIRTRRRLEARVALQRSHATFRDGNRAGARLAALPALRLWSPNWPEAALCLISPGLAMRLHERRENGRRITPLPNR